MGVNGFLFCRIKLCSLENFVEEFKLKKKNKEASETTS